MKAIEHDTNIPITKIPERLHDAATLLDASLRDSLGYFRAKAENGICHSIYMRGSLETKEQWDYGIWHNAKDLFDVHIFPSTQWLSQEAQTNELYSVDFNNCTGVFRKCRSRKGLTLDKAVQYLINQIKAKI